jgi:hypothetical protein
VPDVLAPSGGRRQMNTIGIVWDCSQWPFTSSIVAIGSRITDKNSAGARTNMPVMYSSSRSIRLVGSLLTGSLLRRV